MDIPEGKDVGSFPATRYHGSKRKLADWIWSSVSHFDFDSVLDLFSGTASVSYAFKVKGKLVTSNDFLLCNKTVADALVCNSKDTIDTSDIEKLTEIPDHTEPGFIQNTFGGVFFTDEENRWLDVVASRINEMPEGSKRSLAYFCLYQACMMKRPYGLFHRANLYMRTADAVRKFGNKTTWEKSFLDHFSLAAAQANRAVIDTGRQCQAFCRDFLDVPGDFDLVYADPPYLNRKGIGADYMDFYHFLEGLTEYTKWPSRITSRYKHKPYARKPNPWNKKDSIFKAFDAMIDRYRRSILVISYRDDGIPSIEDVLSALKKHGRRNVSTRRIDYRYSVSKGSKSEALLVSEPSL